MSELDHFEIRDKNGKFIAEVPYTYKQLYGSFSHSAIVLSNWLCENNMHADSVDIFEIDKDNRAKYIENIHDYLESYLTKVGLWKGHDYPMQLIRKGLI